MTKTRIIMLGAYAAAAIATSAAVFPDQAEAAIACRGRQSGEGSATGLFGQGTVLARQNAVNDWTNKATTRHGRGFANISTARGVTYDCRDGAIFQAKCVVTAAPCGEVRSRTTRKKKRRPSR